MADNYKHLYEQMKKMVEKYQDEIVPGLWKLVDSRLEVVRCKDCVHFRDYIDRYGVVQMYCIKSNHIPKVEPEHFCSYGERREDDATD